MRPASQPASLLAHPLICTPAHPHARSPARWPPSRRVSQRASQPTQTNYPPCSRVENDELATYAPAQPAIYNTSTSAQLGWPPFLSLQPAPPVPSRTFLCSPMPLHQHGFPLSLRYSPFYPSSHTFTKRSQAVHMYPLHRSVCEQASTQAFFLSPPLDYTLILHLFSLSFSVSLNLIRLVELRLGRLQFRLAHPPAFLSSWSPQSFRQRFFVETFATDSVSFSRHPFLSLVRSCADAAPRCRGPCAP